MFNAHLYFLIVFLRIISSRGWGRQCLQCRNKRGWVGGLNRSKAAVFLSATVTLSPKDPMAAFIASATTCRATRFRLKSMRRHSIALSDNFKCFKRQIGQHCRATSLDAWRSSWKKFSSDITSCRARTANQSGQSEHCSVTYCRRMVWGVYPSKQIVLLKTS